MTITIRNATVEDRTRINQLDADFPDLTERAENIPDEMFEAMVIHGPNKGLHLLVADDAGAVVGFAMTTPRRTASGAMDEVSAALILARVMVDPAVRRSGAGSLLVAGVEARLRARRTGMIQAHIPASAEAFYVANGWTVEKPGRAIAWIEQPSRELWDQGTRAGFDMGPRRAITMLRTEDASADDDTGYDHLAYKVLHPDRLIEYFPFSTSGGGAIIGALNSTYDVMRLLTDECNADPQRFARLPPDVSKQVYDMGLVPFLGQHRADEIKRARH